MNLFKFESDEAKVITLGIMIVVLAILFWLSMEQWNDRKMAAMGMCWQPTGAVNSLVVAWGKCK